MSKLRTAGFLVASSWLALSGGALAQQAEPAEESVDSGEVVVTAQRRAERVQDVPISIVALDSSDLERLGADTPGQLANVLPNVSFQTQQGDLGIPIFNIRGVTLIDFSYANEATVSIYSDDVYLGLPAIINQGSYDIERVEVLRGPQGTLYGRNATGGLINYLTRQPTDDFNAQLALEYGTYNNVTVDGAVGGPLSDRVRGRIAAHYNSKDDWQEDLGPANDHGGIDFNYGIRGQLDIDVTEALTVGLNAHVGDLEGRATGRAFFGRRDPDDLTVECSVQDVFASLCSNRAGFNDPDPDPEHVFQNTNTDTSLRTFGGSVRADLDLQNVSLTSITAYEWAEYRDSADIDASPGDVANLGLRDSADYEQFSQELRATGEAGPVQWQVGAFHYQDTRFLTFILYELGGVGNYVDANVDTDAVYTQNTWAITPQLNLTGGLRYTWETKEIVNANRVTGGVVATRQGTPVFTVPYDSLEEERLTWRVALDYSPTDELMYFVSASEGFKSGAFNGGNAATVPGLGPVDPETLLSYEAGVRSQWFDRRFTANATVFYLDYRDVQANGSIGDGVNPPFNLLTNIGDAEVYGAELEFVLRPTASITAGLNIGITEGEYVTPGVTFNGVAVEGNSLVNTPELSAAASLRWDHPISATNSIFASVDASYQTEVFFGPENIQIEQQEAYTLVGFRGGWRTEGPSTFTVEAFVNNAFDEEYFQGMAELTGFTSGYWGTPRTVGIRLSADY